MHWNPQQEAALRAVSAWLREGSAPFFYLAGYAGTGKTTLARHFAEGVKGEVLFGAFTGKAAAVMRDSGCPEATTIHRLIYRPKVKGGRRLRELRDELDAAQDDGVREALRARIRDEVKALRTPGFVLNEESPVRGAGLVVIDECSMVGEKMGEDLLSFGAPVLVLGDPAQLPPVGSGGFFTDREPDAMLTEVHRQARESGILRLATMVRSGERLGECDLGDAVVCGRGDVSLGDLLGYDQVLVGRNATRRRTNGRLRRILGRADELPESGDRLVCLRNNHDLGLLNGETWRTLDSCPLGDRVGLTIENGDDVQNVTAWSCIFRGEELDRWSHSRDTQEFDYGYALTCHKAQGSQWPKVAVFDESAAFRKDRARWLYTAITRASERLTVIR